MGPCVLFLPQNGKDKGQGVCLQACYSDYSPRPRYLAVLLAKQNGIKTSSKDLGEILLHTKVCLH